MTPYQSKLRKNLGNKGSERLLTYVVYFLLRIVRFRPKSSKGSLKRGKLWRKTAATAVSTCRCPPGIDPKWVWPSQNYLQMSPDVSLPQFNVLGHRQRIIEASLSSGNYSRWILKKYFFSIFQNTKKYRFSWLFYRFCCFLVCAWLAFLNPLSSWYFSLW